LRLHPLKRLVAGALLVRDHEAPGLPALAAPLGRGKQQLVDAATQADQILLGPWGARSLGLSISSIERDIALIAASHPILRPAQRTHVADRTIISYGDLVHGRAGAMG